MARQVEVFCYVKEVHETSGHTVFKRDDSGNLVKNSRGRGVFAGYSSSYEELENGVGQYPVMLVEFPDGSVEDIPLSLVRFTENE